MKNSLKIQLFLLCISLSIIGGGALAQAIPKDQANIKPTAPAASSQANANQSAPSNQPTMSPAAQPAAQPMTTAQPVAANREQDHEELRALLKSARDAVNAKNFEALKPIFHEKFSITTVDQKVFTNFDDFKKEFATLFTGDKAPLKSITFNPEADALTEFVGDNIGLSHGSSKDTYVFSDGDTREMTSRWTATVIKDNGKWKILNLHIGTNLLDNPVTEAAKSYLYKVGIGAGIGGLLLGFVLAWVIRGKK
jgi:ketosteroid isomerase-like protein